MPFTKEDYRKAESMLKEAEHFYLSATVAQDITETRVQAGAVIYYIENAIAMLNKKYFHYGTKRVYEELDSMENKPAWLSEMIESILSATSTNQLKSYLSILIQETVRTFKKVEQSICPPKKPVTADSVKGTYEEMFSNWRNKMYAASDNNDRHLAYMSMISLNNMIAEIGADTEIAAYDVLGGYHPQNLEKTAQAVDELLTQYLKEYQKADLSIAHFKDTDSFVAHYLSKDET